MKKRDKLFSVEDEVALHTDMNRERTHLEDMPEAPEKEADSNACYYSSTAFEPGVGNGDSAEYRELIRMEQECFPASSAPFLSILAGIAGGLFAVPAVFLDTLGSSLGFILGLGATVVIGPFAEETLKQSGAVFQLEKMRGSLRYGWQFFLSGAGRRGLQRAGEPHLPVHLPENSPAGEAGGYHSVPLDHLHGAAHPLHRDLLHGASACMAGKPRKRASLPDL